MSTAVQTRHLQIQPTHHANVLLITSRAGFVAQNLKGPLMRLSVLVLDEVAQLMRSNRRDLKARKGRAHLCCVADPAPHAVRAGKPHHTAQQ